MSRSDRIRNKDLQKATKQESAEILLKRRRWTWIGHMLRRLCNSITKSGTHKDKGEKAGPRTCGEEEWSSS